MKKIEWARWSTPQEIDKLKASFKKQNQISGLEWLAKNKEKVIDDHFEFIHNFYRKKLAEAKQKFETNLSEVLQNNNDIDKLFDILKNGGRVQCVCKGNLRLIPYNGSHFIGCDNFRENVQHSKFYYRNFNNNFDEDNFRENFVMTKIYLTILMREYRYPNFVKASNLYEFLKINGVEMAVEIDEGNFYRASLSSKKSKDRERIIKPILEDIFDKVWHQLHITVKYEDENQRIKIPDFICKRNEMLYIFEQKKSVDNCSESQLDEYVELVKFITKNDNVNGYFIIEEETNNDFFKENPNYFTIKTLQNDFN